MLLLVKVRVLGFSVLLRSTPFLAVALLREVARLGLPRVEAVLWLLVFLAERVDASGLSADFVLPRWSRSCRDCGREPSSFALPR